MAVNLHNPIPQKWTLPAIPAGLNQKYTNATTSSIPGIRAYLAPFSDAARESGIPNTLVKIAKGIGQYFNTLEPSAAAKDFVGNCNIINDTVKVLNFAKGVDDILTNVDKKNAKGIDLHQRNLGIASGFFQLIVSGMGAAKLLNTFQVISLADISSALGTTTVLPFAVVGNGVEIVKNVIDITNKSLKVHKTRTRKAEIQAKHKNFKANKKTGMNDVANSAKIALFLDSQIAKIEQKDDAAIQKLNDQTELNNAQAIAQKAADEYQEILDDLADPAVSKLQKLIITLTAAKWRQERTLFEAKAAYDQIVDDYTKTSAKLHGRVEKLDAWKNVKAQFDINARVVGPRIKRDANGILDGTDLVNQMIASKTDKWKAIRKNCNLDNLKDGIGIAISVVATIGLIAAIVLTFTGVGTIPVLLTMTSLWLLVSLAGLGNTLLSKYKKPMAVPRTDYRYFAAAAVA